MLFNDPDSIDKGKKIHERARILRGRFLNSVASIEHDLAEIITGHFCADDEAKRELFFEKIACSFSLEKKKRIVSDITKSTSPSFFDEHREIFNSIQVIQEFRNKLAHSIVDVNRNSIHRPIEEGIGFVQWKKGEPITEEAFEDWEAKVGKVSSMLGQIKNLLNLPGDEIA